MLDISDIMGLTVDAGSEPTYKEKNESTPPPPGISCHSEKAIICSASTHNCSLPENKVLKVSC